MSDTIVEIPLDQLHESPFNHRTIFNEAALQGLADNIKEVGVQQPLKVRPRVPALFANSGDPDAIVGYEIVFGHRRYRAAELARLATVPCMVRSMTDAEVKRAQLAENIQREDVTALEEAVGFQALIDDHGETPDTIAGQIGKGRSYVYGRLQLLSLSPIVRASLQAGEISADVALLIARLRTEKLQQKAVARIGAMNWDLKDGGKASYRRIKHELADRFTLKLKESLFDREDAALLPDAGVCSACPKRAGNAPVFEDLATDGTSYWPSANNKGRGEPNLCTDPDCWEAKTKAHLARAAAKLAEEGKTVVSGNKARSAIGADGAVKGDFVPLEKVRAALKKANTKPVVHHIQDQRTGKVVQAVLHADLVGAGLAKKEEKPQSARDAQAERNRLYEKEKHEREAKQKSETLGRRNLLLTVREAAAHRERTEFELRLVTTAALGGVGYEDRQTLTWLYDVKGYEALQKRVDTMTAAELTTLLLDCAIVDEVTVSYGGLNRKPGPLLALANHYGINGREVMVQASGQGPDTPSPAARAPKEAKKPKARAGAKKGKPAAAAGSPGETGSAGQEQTNDAGSAGGSDAPAGDLVDAAEVL